MFNEKSEFEKFKEFVERELPAMSATVRAEAKNGQMIAIEVTGTKPAIKATVLSLLESIAESFGVSTNTLLNDLQTAIALKDSLFNSKCIWRC